MNERVACLALLSVIIACAAPTPAPAAAPAPPAPSVQPASDDDDGVAARDPGVQDCEANLDNCHGVALLDPDPAWRRGLSRLAEERARLCQQGDAAGCYRAWMYGARSQPLLPRGCALGLARACTELGVQHHLAERNPSPLGPVQACQRGVEEACRPAGACTAPSPCAALEATWKANPPRQLPSNTVEARRIAGDKNLLPPDLVKVQMVQIGRAQIIASIKLCLDARGVPERIQFLKSSGFRGYDHLLREQIRGWRYQPIEIDGAPAPVCTAVTFKYRQE